MFRFVKFVMSQSHCPSPSQSQKSAVQIERQLLRVKDALCSTGKRTMKIGGDVGRRRKFTPRHKWDGVPENYQLIFESNLKDYIGAFRIGMTAVGAVSVGLVSMNKSNESFKRATEEDKVILGLGLSVVLCIVIATNVACRNFFKRIYCHSSKPEFMAVRRTCFGRNEHLSYQPSDIVFEPKPGQEFQDGALVKINGRKVHLGAADFISPSFYNMHLGSHHETLEKSQFGGPTTFS